MHGLSAEQEDGQDDKKQQENHPDPPRHPPPERPSVVVVGRRRAVSVSRAVQTYPNPFPQTIETGIITTIPWRQRRLVATI
jgi:hypothetical protein